MARLFQEKIWCKLQRATVQTGFNCLNENFKSWAALNERVELNSRSSSRTSRSSRNHNSHKIRDARVQQKLTLNATKVESLNLPPPSNQDDRFKDSGNSV